MLVQTLLLAVQLAGDPGPASRDAEGLHFHALFDRTRSALITTSPSSPPVATPESLRWSLGASAPLASSLETKSAPRLTGAAAWYLRSLDSMHIRQAPEASGELALSRPGAPSSAILSPFRPQQQVSDRWFAEDKLKHYFASFVITSLAAGATRAAGLDHDESLVVGTSIGVISGIYKEITDARTSIFSFRDLVWDAAGIGTAVLLLDQTR